MSSIVPGPKKKLEEEITAARAGAKPLDPSVLSPSAPRVEALTGLDDWPATLRATVEAEHARVTTLDTNRHKTADRAVPAVTDGLDTLLRDITDRLGKPRLLGKPPAGTTRGDHRTALRTIKQLRSQLKELEAAPDHSRLTRLTTFVIRLAVAFEADPSAAATSAPAALARFAQAAPDPDWNKTFAEKLAAWKQTLTTERD